MLSEIDALGEKLKRRIPADAVPVQRLRWLNRYFFRELGFAGNVNDYYDPRNSYLHEVLQHAARHPDHARGAVHRAGDADRAHRAAACRFPGTSSSS